MAPSSPPAPRSKPPRAPPGLEYRHLPVDGGWQSPEADRRLQAALLAELPRPLLAFCRSGARSTRLFVSATQG